MGAPMARVGWALGLWAGAVRYQASAWAAGRAEPVVEPGSGVTASEKRFLAPYLPTLTEGPSAP